ncbi:MAG: hypothetical protein LBW85_13440, partial [Deltaproteobacteria bacterium]|nr:hypothetical protein [Deltaproteobacteria bacterium]
MRIPFPPRLGADAVILFLLPILFLILASPLAAQTAGQPLSSPAEPSGAGQAAAPDAGKPGAPPAADAAKPDSDGGQAAADAAKPSADAEQAAAGAGKPAAAAPAGPWRPEWSFDKMSQPFEKRRREAEALSGQGNLPKAEGYWVSLAEALSKQRGGASDPRTFAARSRAARLSLENGRPRDALAEAAAASHG